MRTIRYTPHAREALELLASEIASGEGLEEAWSFVEWVRTNGRRIAALPQAGEWRAEFMPGLYLPGLYSAPERDRYVIFYHFTEEYVDVVHVCPSSRDAQPVR